MIPSATPTAADREEHARAVADRTQSLIDMTSGMQPAQAAAVMANLGGNNLPSEARALLTFIQFVREQEEYREINRTESAHRFRHYVDDLRMTLARPPERVTADNVAGNGEDREARRRRDHGAALVALAAIASSLTTEQAAIYGLAYTDSADVPVQAKRHREIGQQVAVLTDAELDLARTRARGRENSEQLVAAIDDLASVTADRIRQDVDKVAIASEDGSRLASVDSVKIRLTETYRNLPSLTPEQRDQVAETIDIAIDRYVERRGLQAGIPVDAAALAEHAPGLREAVVSGLLNAIDDGLGLDQATLDAIQDGIVQRVEAIAINGPGRALAIVDAAAETKRAMEAAGLDPGERLDGVNVLADIGRGQLLDTDRIMRQGRATSPADRAEIVAAAGATYDAARIVLEDHQRHDHRASREAGFEAPRIHNGTPQVETQLAEAPHIEKQRAETIWIGTHGTGLIGAWRSRPTPPAPEPLPTGAQTVAAVTSNGASHTDIGSQALAERVSAIVHSRLGSASADAGQSHAQPESRHESESDYENEGRRFS